MEALELPTTLWAIHSIGVAVVVVHVITETVHYQPAVVSEAVAVAHKHTAAHAIQDQVMVMELVAEWH
jgi:hypothetical protein